MTEFVAENYTNEFGQVLKPGDIVVMVTTGYSHNVKIRSGVYLGVNKDGYGKVSSLSCEYAGRQYDYKNKTWSDKTIKTALKLKRAYKLDTNTWGMKHV